MKFCEELGVEPADPVMVGELVSRQVHGALLCFTALESSCLHAKFGYTSHGCVHLAIVLSFHAQLLALRAHCTRLLPTHMHVLCRVVRCRLQLVIANHMGAATMGEFTKEEWNTGMVKLGCDSCDKLRAKLPELRAELVHEDRFKDIYNYAYLFSREVRAWAGMCVCVSVHTAGYMHAVLTKQVMT